MQLDPTRIRPMHKVGVSMCNWTYHGQGLFARFVLACATRSILNRASLRARAAYPGPAVKERTSLLATAGLACITGRITGPRQARASMCKGTHQDRASRSQY